ncbi:MATE family efflux transporter [Clostridium felsineum]|uniref:MATE family efflux transporter n=1 Tax=Clostridium felsineum TaxID=36839 RepID=UPI0009D2A267|nr:MATE family efflux transporter [Clostridium felsineum]MCR3758307.1 MATE family efflux transporter [Clostridium felsineum]URZ03649.1 Multidrug resistance protein MdtK [Clostridium felsineum]
MNKTRIKDMTEGNPLQLIFTFALPIFLGNIFQQLYNVLDTMIAGYNLGDNALAAIGATSAIYSLIIGMANGMNNGYSIIVARSYGEKNMEKLRHSVGVMLILNVITALLFTLLSCIFIMPILKLLNTPPEIIKDAYEFIIIILLGITSTILYNMEAGVLRALGNSKTPLVFLIISLFFNLAMDLIFVVIMHGGVWSTALATVLSEVLSVILCFIHIVKYYPELKLSKKHFHFDKELIIEMFTTGLSMGLMSSIFALGTVILQGSINSLGKATITAHLAARKLDEMLMLPLSTLVTANATFVGQNYGAKKINRIREGIKKTCILGFIWATFCVLIAYTAAPILTKALTGTSDSYITNMAAKYLKINLPFFYVLHILLVLRTSLQGIGRKIAPLISSSIEMIGKFAAVLWLVPKLGYLGVCIVEPILWVLCTLFLLGTFFKIEKDFEKLKIS